MYLDDRISHLSAHLQVKPHDRQAKDALARLITKRDGQLRWDAWMKALYPPEAIGMALTRRHPFMSMLRRA